MDHLSPSVVLSLVFFSCFNGIGTDEVVPCCYKKRVSFSLQLFIYQTCPVFSCVNAPVFLCFFFFFVFFFYSKYPYVFFITISDLRNIFLLFFCFMLLQFLRFVIITFFFHLMKYSEISGLMHQSSPQCWRRLGLTLTFLNLLFWYLISLYHL